MLQKIKFYFAEMKNRRLQRRNKPWSKKQKIIFLSVLFIVLIYAGVSAIISGEGEKFIPPKLNLSVSSLDISLICILALCFAVVKIRNHLKGRKGKK